MLFKYKVALVDSAETSYDGSVSRVKCSVAFLVFGDIKIKVLLDVI